jgi:hypothetical protein
MRTLKWNGEKWYYDERSRWKRCRQWLIWLGGWEKPNGTGWKFLIDYGNKKSLMSPAPLSLFGHLFTWFGWGWQLKLKRWHRWLVWSKSGFYVSSDGTPPDSGRNEGFFIYRRKQKSALLRRLRREERA